MSPIYCKYSYSRKFDVLFIITLVLSAFGGVSIILRLLAFFSVKFLFRVNAWSIRKNAIGVQMIQESTRIIVGEF